MAYLVIYLLLSAVGTIIALAIVTQGARDDEALEKLMEETEPVTPLKKSAKNLIEQRINHSRYYAAIKSRTSLEIPEYESGSSAPKSKTRPNTR